MEQTEIGFIPHKNLTVAFSVFPNTKILFKIKIILDYPHDGKNRV